jgi:hypothetical protein
LDAGQACAKLLQRAQVIAVEFIGFADQLLIKAALRMLVATDELKQRMTKPPSDPEPCMNLLLGLCTLRLR